MSGWRNLAGSSGLKGRGEATFIADRWDTVETRAKLDAASAIVNRAAMTLA
jgi:hypothetical protein